MSHREKYKTFKTLSLKELEKISTKRLLNLFKIARSHKYSVMDLCDCCGEYIVRKGDDPKRKEERDRRVEEAEIYFETIKGILEKREHVVR